MATQVTLGSGVVDSAAGLKLRTNGSTEAVDISTGQVVTLAKDAIVNGLTVGKGAGAVSTNTAVGASALSGSVTGGYNTGVGYQALQANTSGQLNTAVGRNSMVNTTTGSENSAYGDDTLSANTTGQYNVAIGRQSLKSNTTASNNTAVGYQAGYSQTTANSNTSIGYQSLFTNQTGITNVAIGVNAGYALTSSNNTLVGVSAGSAVTTGEANTFIGRSSAAAGGYGAGALVTTGGKNTIVGGYNGNQGGLDIRTASNYIVLSDGDGNPRGIFDSSGNLLVGKTAQSVTTVGGEILPSGTFNSTLSASVNSTATFQAYSTGASAYRFYVGMGGTVFATSTTISAISDIRFKENVRDLDVGLAEVMSLKPRLYDWKEGKGADVKNARGFIAQEFEEVFPDLIDEWKDPAPEGEEPYKSVRQDLIPVLVKAIQEQQALITQLQDDVSALKGQA